MLCFWIELQSLYLCCVCVWLLHDVYLCFNGYHLTVLGITQYLYLSDACILSLYLIFSLLQVLAEYSFNESTKDSVMSILSTFAPEVSCSADNIEDISTEESFERKHEESVQLEEVWQMLYNDCISALEVCVEGDLKHFHKARYMLAQGLYKRGLNGDLERAKDELSFCFKSSRSSFTINMWEIDGMVKKGRY